MVEWKGTGAQCHGKPMTLGSVAGRRMSAELTSDRWPPTIPGRMKVQLQVPEARFAGIEESAQRREWSLAGTFRRGAELLL